jgi:competence protein ComGC
MSIKIKKSKKWWMLAGSLAVSILFLLICAQSIFNFNSNIEKKQVEIVKQAVEKAVINCYSLEGSYPPDIQYLHNNYGLVVDSNHYVYDYRIFASNLPPEIFIFKKNK